MAWIYFRSTKKLLPAKKSAASYLRSGLVAVETAKGTVYAVASATKEVLELCGQPKAVVDHQVPVVPLVQVQPIVPAPPRKRISVNKLIYQVNGKELYATRAVVTASNLALKAARAFVVLTMDEAHPMHLAGPNHKDALYRISPAWDPEFEPPSDYHRTLGNLNRGIPGGMAVNPNGAAYFSHADCHRNAQTVMGSNSVGSVIDTERPVLYPANGRTLLVPPSKAAAKEEAGLVDSHANRGVYAFLCQQLPSFADVLAPRVGVSVKLAQLEASLRQLAGFSSETVNAGWTIYSELLAQPGIAALLAQTFGINECITPQVGDGISQVNNEVERKNAPDGVELWNFHWAGVVMRDGASYVTLENLSVENDDVLNTAWYFKLYGPGAKSFHAENALDDHVGDFPITLGFVSVAGAAAPKLAIKGMQGNFVCAECGQAFGGKMALVSHRFQSNHAID